MSAAVDKKRMRDFFSKDEITALIEALDNFEIDLSSKQMDWADDITYRFEMYGMAAYCFDSDREFINRLMDRVKLEREAK